MGSQTVTVNNGTQLFVDTDISQCFLGNTFTRQNVSVNNSTYDPITILVGTAMGRITASGSVTPFLSTATDGSQNIIGLLNNTVIIPSGESPTLAIVIKGEVATNKVVFYNGTDTLDTIVSGKRVVDKIASETAGILLVNSREMTAFDNS